MSGKHKLREIAALRKKKTRDERRLFVVEGDKIVKDFLYSGMEIETLAAKPEFIAGLTRDKLNSLPEIIPVSYEELRKISSLSTPHNALAVVRIPVWKAKEEDILSKLCVALDFVQDPGNLGTIIRAASWFGISDIICSFNCVDVFNPKVIQSTMGAILNTRIHYLDLEKFLSFARLAGLPVYGTLIEGEPVYNHKLGPLGVILLGNESKGISPALEQHITDRISIPKFSDSKYGIDSLNVGMAASVIFSEFARRRSL